MVVVCQVSMRICIDRFDYVQTNVYMTMLSIKNIDDDLELPVRHVNLHPTKNRRHASVIVAQPLPTAACAVLAKEA